MSNVFSFSDLRKDERESDDKGARQTYYAGGAKSGVAIVGPDSAQKGAPTDAFFENARRDEGQKIEAKQGETVLRVQVVFFADGMTYQVEDGETVHKSYSEEEGKEFVEALQSGKLPMVLRAVRARDGTVPLFDFCISDQRSKKYTPPSPKPAKLVAFSGLFLMPTQRKHCFANTNTHFLNINRGSAHNRMQHCCRSDVWFMWT